jgi:hypothetical protein
MVGKSGRRSQTNLREGLTYIPVMLYLRQRPPADMPNVNSGKPWSEMDIRDLKVALQYNRTVAEIADFLCRDVEEVEAKIAELRRH